MKSHKQPKKKVWVIPRNFIVVDPDLPDIWYVVLNPYWDNWFQTRNS